MSQSGMEFNMAPTMDPSWQASDNAGVAASDPGVFALGTDQPVRAAAKRCGVSVIPCPPWKRAIDIVGAIAGLAVLWPLLLAVAALIKCVSKGPIFFRQRRFGAGGRPFILWKFRTLEINEAAIKHRSHVSGLMDNNLPLTKRDYELGIIPGGRILRKFGLDELPQLINVLKGEMSLVGPRPDVVPLWNYQVWQRRRFEVRPGITGLWQVCGKNDTTFDTMMRMDILYIRRRSFWLDMIILLRTIPAIMRS